MRINTWWLNKGLSKLLSKFKVKERSLQTQSESFNFFFQQVQEDYTYDVIHVRVRDKEEVLRNCAMWATTNVESYPKRREYDAGLVPSNR